jgi:hypothetical protein
MAGFDNGTMQGGVFFQAKQFGAVLRGFGIPAPQAGNVGDLYIDANSGQCFNRRSTGNSGNVDPWGHYLFTLPAPYKTRLKWFGTVAPPNSVGVDGDYFLLWGGFPNYGMQASVYGPRAGGVWPSVPTVLALDVNPLYSAEDTHSV